MKIKLSKHVLVGDTDVVATRAGTVVTLNAAQGAEFVKLGLGEEVKAAADMTLEDTQHGQTQAAPVTKSAPAHENKMAATAAKKESK